MLCLLDYYSCPCVQVEAGKEHLRASLRFPVSQTVMNVGLVLFILVIFIPHEYSICIAAVFRSISPLLMHLLYICPCAAVQAGAAGMSY